MTKIEVSTFVHLLNLKCDAMSVTKFDLSDITITATGNHDQTIAIV